MSTETQQSVSDWSAETFGISTPVRAATRMNQEVAELLAMLTIPDTPAQKIREEIADVQIVLFTLARRMGMDMQVEVDRKMEINRARKWKLDGSGCGQHED